MSTVISQVEPPMEENPSPRRGSKAYQIFPETNTNDDSDSMPEGFLYKRERLPSIVVEPIEHNDQESGLLPPRCLMGNSVEEEQEEDSGADHTDNSVDGEQEDAGTDDGSVVRKSSIGPSSSQLALSRLTPPASPTPPEAAPPCLRS